MPPNSRCWTTSKQARLHDLIRVLRGRTQPQQLDDDSAPREDTIEHHGLLSAQARLEEKKQDHEQLLAANE